MNENAPFEPPQNYSQIKSEGELTPSISPRSGFSRYVDDGGNFHFRISEFGIDEETQPREKQMVIQQLASFVAPVAPIYEAVVDDMKDHFSINIENHPEFSGTNKFSEADNVFLQIMFNDLDHEPSHNHAGGVFYDFNVGSLSRMDKDSAMYYKDILDMVNRNPKNITLLKQKILFFKQQIEGEGGLKFITDTCKHAGYTEISPEEIQRNLIEKSDTCLNLIGEIVS